MAGRCLWGEDVWAPLCACLRASQRGCALHCSPSRSHPMPPVLTGLTELHRHLDGSLRPDTLHQLRAAAGFPPVSTPRFRPGMGLTAALQCFTHTLEALQTPAALRRVAAECCEDAIAEGIGHLELRFAPQLHTFGAVGDVVDCVLEGVAGRAGIILCGLYGESPALLEALVEAARDRSGVVGLDLAGGPLPDHRYGLVDYAVAYTEAGRIGLGRTVHAGEGRPPNEIVQAVEVLGADRIGHGLTVLDSERAVALLVERGVVIEACPTSNWHVGLLDAPDEHPLARWLEVGLSVAVCTDNTLMSAVDLPVELARIGAEPGTEPWDRLQAGARRGWFLRGPARPRASGGVEDGLPTAQ
ncbi:MAG TPA: hypothetical protein DFR83_13425 [Deltaproteobacteria bacterium]|nr:hypothetical protein [Deltaproteobacteria bacterium]